MEKRSRQRVRDQVALMAFGAETRMRSSARGLSMLARNTNVPFKGRIQKRKIHDLQIITFGLQRAAGPYRRARRRHHRCERLEELASDLRCRFYLIQSVRRHHSIVTPARIEVLVHRT
jgi:hypothetical protein